MTPRRPTPMDAGALRRRNLSAVLELVHRHGGVTRADLTRALGLNRSTIGDLVAVLVEHGWVDERDDAPRSGVGRPSPRVAPSDTRVVAAVNPELDVIDVGLVSLGGQIVARRRVALDHVPSVAETVAITAQTVRELAAEAPHVEVRAVGVAVPGLVRRRDGQVRLAPHLGWREEPLAAPLAEALGMPVSASNDAHLGCRAEQTFGAGVGAGTMLYLNGGPSGIGGGLVVDGRPMDGTAGYAGELGHLGLDPAGPLCACGARGCLEALAPRDALVAAVGLEHPDDDALEEALVAAVAAEDADGAARTEVARQLRWLAVALRGAVNFVNPDRIVLGGHLAALWRCADEAQRASLIADALPASAAEVTIEPAALGAQRLLIGAAELAWDELIADPIDALTTPALAEA
ncbi:ROK family transcriptional regulator [Microcella putealis]|nr:ROK family transcriptional regulator [Microcella putealis]